MSNLAYGTFTITNLSVVTSVDVYYYNSTSSSSLSGGSWQTTTPTWTNGKYIWSKTVTTWEQGVTTQSKPVCITGQKGSTGLTGQSVTSIVEQYALSTSNTTAPTTGWSNTMPPFEANKYYWTRSKITWANPTNTTYTDAVLANGITSANTTANAANTTATQANQTANTANQTANAASQTAAQAASAAAAAQSTANDATSIANGKNTIYYGANFPAGGTYKAGDTFFKQTAEGYIIYKYDTTDNQWVKESLDEQGITQITNAKIANLDGGKINAGTITSLKLSTDAIKSRNYQAGTAPYSGAGTFLDLTQGNIYTPNFGVNNDSLDSIDDGAYIRGSIYAHKGTIGQSSTNYWYIGNYKDYNQVNSAMIKGYGTATIQLGESNTWRLNTNRIHTAWNDDSSANEAYRLHYLTRDSKYWDMGLHVPTAGIDKFIYIRSSKSDTSTANILENLQNSLEDNLDGTNNYWTYKFFISADGGIYARNIYAIDENGNYTLISGANGAYLLKSGGTIQNNLVINGTLQVKGNYLNKNGSALTLQTNLGSTTAGTLTGNTTSAISIGVTGTLPSSNGGTGNTNWNQGGVVYIDGSSPKKLLSTAAGTSGYLLKSNGTGAPTWINPATLTVAAATKATQDGDGNVIKTTYLKLSGGNVTGPVSFGDSVSVDDLNAGTLVVTGNASFANNIQANTINGVTVGSSPKFTDTVTTVTTSGNGNAVTAITASGGKLTVTKGTTFLTSFTQSDPIFTASVAASIKQTDINNWNSKTSNTGTVTSVAASGSGGITISGSPITTSGTLAIGLNLSTAINGLGEGTSAANRNDYAVVQYAGGGTTTTSYHRRKLSNVFAALNSSDITTALGFTPYNATNPNGYTSNPGTVTSVRVQASSPLQSSTSTAQSSSLNTTISFVNQNANVVLAGPSSGSAAAPVFRALVAADIPSLTKSKISDFPTTWALSSVTGADDLKAIEALTGTSGFLKKTANTWDLDTNTYLTAHQTVTDKNPTLAWGTKSAVATIGSTTINVTMPANPNYTANLITGASNSAKITAAASNGSVFLNLVENNIVRNYHNLKGGNGLTVTSDANGVVTFTSPAAFTGVSFNDGKLTFTKSDGNSAELTTSSFVITQAAGATGLVNSSGTGLNVGGATTKPVYFSNGVPVEVTSIPYTLLSGAPSTMTPAFHTHGNIQNGGTLQTTDITIANGDKLIVTDASDSNKIARTSISFDGSTATKALTQKGTWETFNNYSLPLAANGTRGGVQIGYSSSGKNYAVQLSSQKMYVNVPWTDTTYSAGTGLSLSGTTFNHSNSVTAGTAGTSDVTSSTNRTIVIPYITYDAQGHITASGTHTHTLTSFPQAYLSWGGQNFSGSYGCIDAAMVPELGANRFAFLKAAGLQIDYSTDAGATWVSYGATDIQKVNLFANGGSFHLGKATAKANNAINNQLRVIITTNLAGIYTTLNKIVIYMSTNGNNTQVKIERAKKSSPDNYVTHLDWTPISGWAGWNVLNISELTTYGNTDSQQQKIKMTFRQTSVNSNYPSPVIQIIKGFGGMGWTTPSTMAKTGHLYSYDGNQNATFPAQITATQFNGLATTATGDKNGADITTTYLKLAGGTMTGVLTTKSNMYTDAYNSGALNLGNSNIDGVNSIYTADASENAAEGIHFYRDSTHVDSLYAKSGVLYFTPNRALGNAGTDYSVYHSGITTFNGNASTATEFSSNATVTLTGDTTGTSAGSKKSWSIATTTNQITSNELTNQDLNNYKTLSKVLFYYGGGSNTVLNKPSDIHQFGVFTYNTAAEHVTQELSANNRKWIRFWNNSTWSSWQKFITDSNYTDYTVKKDGTGASGSWGISVTGTAANVTGTVAVANGGTGVTSFTSGALLIGNGTSAVGTRTIKNMTAKGNLGWTAVATDIYIPTVNTLAYWDGRYNATLSNLTYCVKGAFGDASIKGVVTTLDSSANLPTASAVKTYVDTTAQNTYVTLTTAQTISGTKTFTGGISMKSSTTTNACNINYNTSLSALVFSFV